MPCERERLRAEITNLFGDKIFFLFIAKRWPKDFVEASQKMNEDSIMWDL